MKNKQEEDIGWAEAVAGALSERWALILDYLGFLAFLIYFALLWQKENNQIILWIAFLLTLAFSGRVVLVACVIRNGSHRNISGNELPGKKVFRAWSSIGWLFLFGVISVILWQGAPCYKQMVPWLMIFLSVAAGVLLAIRRKGSAR